MQFREIPFLRLTVPLCAGVIMAEYLPGMTPVVAIMAVMALAVMTLRLFRRSYLNDLIYGATLMLFLVSSGYLDRTIEMQRLSDLDTGRQEITIRLSDYPDRGNSGYSVRGRILTVEKTDPAGGQDESGSLPGDSINRPGDSINRPTDTITRPDDSLTRPGDSINRHADTITRLRGSMLLWFMTDTLPSRWKPGDLLRVTVRPVRVRNNGNPCEFNYSRYLEGQGIRYMAFFRAGDITGYCQGKRRTLRESSLVTAHRITDAFRRAGLQGEELGLVTALTLGDKELLDRERLTTFSRSGAMHIMAVSGLHVGMISMVLSWILFFMKGRLKQVRPLIIVPALWVFAFITGLSPSVLRATIMFTFLQAGNLINRPAAGMNNLLASAFLIVAGHPGVIFEAGFQLSYLAVAFIINFYTPLCRLVKPGNRILNYFWQVTAVSLVAQAGTLALSVRLFNIFPLLFLLTNIIVIPVCFVVLLLAMALLITSPFPPVASFFALLLDHLAAFTLGFTGIISSSDHGVITDIGMSAAETGMLTISTALLLAALLRTSSISIRPFLAATMILVACNIVKLEQEVRRDRLITYNLRGDILNVRQHGRHLLVPATGGAVPAEIRKHADTRGLKIILIEPG
ncbi:MAG: ComEC/Rec2 family competence protein [Bacteroidales bacterium]